MNFQLGARLKSMLLVDVDDQSESSTSAASEIKNDAAPKKILEVIEEIDEKETKFNNNARISPTENVMVDPCLVTNEASSTLSTQCMQRIGVESMTNNTSDAPSFSLAEQMMTAAVSAQTSQKERQRNEQQNRAKKATFGIKKGFLLKKDKKKKSSSSNTKNVQVVDNVVCDVIEESDQDNLIQDLSSKGKGHTSTTPNPLHIPEVHDALSSHLQSAQSKWASPSFLNSLAQHPKLSKGWNNPKYLAALHSMKTHPQETMEKLKNDEPEILHWLMEFLGVMGDHFVTLGAEEENTEKNGGSGKENNTQRKTPKTTAEPKMIREIGPLEEKAMRVRKEARSTFDSQILHEEKTTDDDDEVAKVLSNEALRSTLLDPKMQQVMEELAHESGVGAGKLQYYMNHKDFGPKLRMLIKAGLLKMA